MTRVLAIVTDLMLGSRVSTSLQSAGHEVRQVTVVPAETAGVDLIVADLDVADPAELGALDVPVIGFYQHTDADTKQRGEDAGLALVVPRSRMARELPELVKRTLSDAA